MRYPTLMLFAIACLMMVSSPTAALWETRFGSEERDFHCAQIDSPTWSSPRLQHFDAWEDEYFSNDHVGLWVIDGNDARYSFHNEGNLLIARTWAAYLKVYTQDFEVLWERQMDFHLAEALDLVDVLGTGESQMVIAPHSGPHTPMYDLRGELLEAWAPASIALIIDVPALHHGMPAAADFTGDGNIELLLHGVYQWYAFNNKGETIAQQPVIHPYDKGWSTSRPHEEDGRTYVYAITMSYPGLTVDDNLPIASRLHKQALEAIPGGLPTPYRFHEVWSKEFPGLVHVDDLRFFDLTGDGQDEIVLSHRPRGHPDTRALSIMDLDGNILYQHPWNTGSKTAIGDANGDGIQEVIVMLIDDADPPTLEEPMKPWTYLSGVQYNGRHFEEIYHFQVDDQFSSQALAVCDVDGDGEAEILTTHGLGLSDTRPHGFGRVKLSKADGSIIWSYEFPYGVPGRPRIVDLDGDGSYEFIVTTSATQLFVFSPTLEPEPAESPRAPADPYITYLLERPHLTHLVAGMDAPATTVADVPASAMLGPVLLALACLILTARKRG